MKSGFVIAATSSGSGKTTLTLGILRSLARMGIAVAPFKCGPDYIDTQFHRCASKRESINLDLFLASEYHVRDMFWRHMRDADVAIVEGVMGLFDGYDRDKGSTADIAESLGLPVVLVINSASTAYSVAAQIHGFSTFKPNLTVAGVVFNRVVSERHYRMLRQACEDAGKECFGYLKRDENLATPSRHLGLALTGNNAMEEFIAKASAAVDAGIDLEKLLDATHINIIKSPAVSETAGMRKPLNVTVAHDDAFNFIYPANIEALESNPRRKGCIRWMSPLEDDGLPEDTDLLYLPGGYPELYADRLSGNRKMLKAVKDYAENGGAIIAECGGLIYLCNAIDGIKLSGVLPLQATMEQSHLHLGYRRIDFGELELRGHEFHYSCIREPKAMESCAKQYTALGTAVDTPVYRYKNTFATYTHLYWADASTDILKLWNL